MLAFGAASADVNRGILQQRMEERERERSVENPLTKCAVLDHLPKKQANQPVREQASKYA